MIYDEIYMPEEEWRQLLIACIRAMLVHAVRSRRLLLIGESRPDGTPGDAFSGGSSSDRLMRLFGARTHDQMLELVDVVNWADDGPGWEASGYRWPEALRLDGE